MPQFHLINFFEPSATNISGKQDDFQIAFLSSHCGVRDRDMLYLNLSQHFKVYSFGTCFPTHNASELIPECEIASSNREDRNWDKRNCLLSKFKFSLQVENGLVMPGYVTEKFLWNFQLPTIPIYLGADDVAHFDPGQHSFINVKDFTGTESLIEYIKQVMNNETLYTEYFEWKRKKYLSPKYQNLYNHNWHNIWCRMCEYLAERS